MGESLRIDLEKIDNAYILQINHDKTVQTIADDTDQKKSFQDRDEALKAICDYVTKEMEAK